MIQLEAWLAARALGWALVHFLWQGALIAALLELVLACTRRSSSELRYLVRCGALLAMALAPVLTFAVIRSTQPPAEAFQRAAEAGSAPSTPWVADAWPVLVVILWSLGAALLGARFLRDYWSVRQLVVGASDSVLPREWQARFESLARAMGVRAVARVVDSARLGAPAVIGALRPVVLLPARVLTGLTPDQIEAVIAHELAHVRRHDYLVNLLQSAIEAALFYHPAVWWVSHGIRAEREYCCDDAAVRVSADRVSYARALTTLESWRIAPAAGVSTLGGSLMLRVQRLIGIHQSPRPAGALSFLGTLLGASLFAAVALGNSAPAQDSADLRALSARIEALRARLDELTEMSQRLHELHGQQTQAQGGAEARRVRTLDELFESEGRADAEHGEGHDAEQHMRRLHELLQGAGRADDANTDAFGRALRFREQGARRAQAEQAGAQDDAQRFRSLHQLFQHAHGAEAAGDADQTLRGLTGMHAARIHQQVLEALKQHGVDAGTQVEVRRELLESLRTNREAFRNSYLDEATRQRIHEALEQAAKAREDTADHRQAWRSLLDGTQGQRIDLQQLHEHLQRSPAALRALDRIDFQQIQQQLQEAQDAGKLRHLEGVDFDALREHLEKVREQLDRLREAQREDAPANVRSRELQGTF